MEWNDREKKIIDQLHQHTEPVDTESLWAGIKPSLPVRRKNNVLPLIFCFLTGLGFGIGGYQIFGNNSKGLDSNEPQEWQTEKSVLLKELQLCKEPKNQDEQANIQPNIQQLKNSTPQTYPSKSLIPLRLENIKPTTEIADVMQPNTPSATKQLLSQNDMIFTTITKAGIQDADFSGLENKNIILFKNDIPLLIQPIISVAAKPEKTKILSYVLAGGGITLVRDKLILEENTLNTNHQPMIHYALEYGLQKRWKKNWLLNVGLNYTGLTSHIRYNLTKTEDILITDTTGYYVGPDGITTSEIGDVIATKITKKSGKTYNYSHQLMLHPTIEYDIPLNLTSSFSIRLGAMLPLVSWQKNSILNADGEVQRIPSGLRYFETPFLSGGLMYNKILNEKTLGFYLDFLLGSQNIQTGSYITARTFFLPQTGMRIIF